MTEVLFVYENDIPFLYTKSENGSVQKKRIALVDANPENLRQKRIRKIQTNYPEHLDYLEKYIGSNSLSKTFQNNFLQELSNPLDNSNFIKNLIQDIHLNRGLSDIRSLSLTRPRFIPLNPINIHDLQYIEAKIMAYFINNNSSIILRRLGDNRETENLIKTLSETENISKFIPYFEMPTNGYQNFIHEQEIKVNEKTFNVLKSIFDKQANLHNTT